MPYRLLDNRAGDVRRRGGLWAPSPWRRRGRRRGETRRRVGILAANMGRRPFAHQRLLREHWSTQVIALDQITAELAQQGELLWTLHSFRDRPWLEAVREVDDQAQDAVVCIVVHRLPHKCLVDLHEVDGKRTDTAEGGMAGAEVIDRDADSFLMKTGERRQRSAVVVEQCRFCDLEAELVRLTRAAAQRVTHQFPEVWVADQWGGEVHRHDQTAHRRGSRAPTP